MTNKEIIVKVELLLAELKTPYVFVVRDTKDIRTSFFPDPQEAGELFARAVSLDPRFGRVLTEAMKFVKFKPNK